MIYKLSSAFLDRPFTTVKLRDGALDHIWFRKLFGGAYLWGGGYLRRLSGEFIGMFYGFYVLCFIWFCKFFGEGICGGAYRGANMDFSGISVDPKYNNKETCMFICKFSYDTKLPVIFF